MFCNVKDDLEKVSKFRAENGYDKTKDLCEDLKACVLMEAASFIGFWNVMLGLYMAKTMKDNMCKMCLPDGASQAEAETQAANEEYVARTKLTKKEKADVCFWLQFVTSLSNGCPTGVGETPAAKTAAKHPFSSLMPMRAPFYNNFCNPCSPCAPPC